MGHTPGPWWYNEHTECIGSPAGWVATLGVRERKSDVPFGKKIDDAHLIAAAPDLLVACKMAFAELGDMRYEGSDDYDVMGVLKAAIAKAEGEAE